MNNRKRVAIVSESMNIGGGEMIAAQLASYIDSELYDVKFFVISMEQNNQIREHLLKNKINYVCLNIPTSFSIKGLRTFCKALDEFSPDIVHEHLDHYYSWIWTMINRIPLVATIHSDPFRRKNWKVDLLIKIREKFGRLKVIGCSKKTEELSITCYRLKRETVAHIYNPIDTSLYKRHNGQADKVIHFVHVGRFEDVKNHELLVKAFNELQNCDIDCDLTLAGDGPLFNYISEQVKKMGLDESVHLLGNVSDIPTLLSSMSIFVLPSKTEACPVVLLEAMASGLPVIASAVGGIPEMVTDNGILISPNDLNSLFDAMMIISKDKAKRLKMSEASIRNVARFDKRVIATEYEKIYTALTMTTKEVKNEKKEST